MTKVLLLTETCVDDSVMDAVEDAVFSSKKDGFADYYLDPKDTTRAWCTGDTAYGNPWLELVFKNVVNIIGVVVGGFSDATLTSFASQFEVATKLQGYHDWRFTSVSFYIFLTFYGHMNIIKGDRMDVDLLVGVICQQGRSIQVWVIVVSKRSRVEG